MVKRDVFPLKGQFHCIHFLSMLIHQSIFYTIQTDVLNVMNQDIEGWPFIAHLAVPFKQVHVALRRVARLTDHDDIIHIVGTTLASWEYMVFC